MQATQSRPQANPNALAIIERRKAEVEDKLAGVRSELIAILGPTIDSDRWLSVASDAVLSNSAILQCEPLSIIVALRTAARYGLEPVGELGEGCLVPYKGQAQFQAMYRGLKKLARNSGDVGQMDAQMVYSNDTFDWQIGTEGFVRHVPAWVRGDRLGAYAWARILSDSSLQIEPMPLEEVERVRSVSKQYQYAEKDRTFDSLWHTWPDEMAKKTAFRRLLKKLPLSAQARDLLAYDDRADAIEGHATEVQRRVQIGGRAAAALDRVKGRHPAEETAPEPTPTPVAAKAEPIVIEGEATEAAGTPPTLEECVEAAKAKGIDKAGWTALVARVLPGNHGNPTPAQLADLLDAIAALPAAS